MKYSIGDLFKEIIKLTLSFLAQLVPKQQNLWIFGAWKGLAYSDNSKYLFAHICRHHPEINAVWLTRNRLAYKLVTQQKYPVAYFGSLRAIWVCMRAAIAITCVDSITDLPMYAISSHTKRVQLWHGLGPKGYSFVQMNKRSMIAASHMDWFSKVINKLVLLYAWMLTTRWYDRISFLPYHQMSPQDLVITTSQLGTEKMQQVFGERARSIEMLGYPRHDHLARLPPATTTNLPIILYAPTHRSESQKTVVPALTQLYAALSQHPRVVFITKLHALTSLEQLDLSHLLRLPNFRLLDEAAIAQDIYTLLPLIDVLITDYSSIYTDYLLLDRPIVFVPFDMAAYHRKDQGFFLEYTAATPGPKATNWQEALQYAETYATWQATFAKARKHTLTLFHTVRDGESSERITQRLLELSNKSPNSIPH